MIDNTHTEDESHLVYSPEKFEEETHGLKPVRHWQAFSLQRLDNPSNFEAD